MRRPSRVLTFCATRKKAVESSMDNSISTIENGLRSILLINALVVRVRIFLTWHEYESRKCEFGQLCFQKTSNQTPPYLGSNKSLFPIRRIFGLVVKRKSVTLEPIFNDILGERAKAIAGRVWGPTNLVTLSLVGKQKDSILCRFAAKVWQLIFLLRMLFFFHEVLEFAGTWILFATKPFGYNLFKPGCSLNMISSASWLAG